jgi:uncharacterized RmlC-like cupin family protein
MNIDEILDGIERGNYPEDPRIEIPPSFENDAGSIANLARGSFGSASFIRSVAGSVRSNHYHQTDSHFIYIVSGFMYYYWRNAAASTPCDRIRVAKGQLIFTPPLVAHATYFPVESQVVTLNKYARDHRHHEADVVRIPALVTKEVCPAVMNGHKCCLPFEETRDAPTNNIHCGNVHETVEGYSYGFGMFGGGFV